MMSFIPLWPPCVIPHIYMVLNFFFLSSQNWDYRINYFSLLYMNSAEGEMWNGILTVNFYIFYHFQQSISNYDKK